MNLNEINKRSCFWYFRHLISVQLVFNIYICMSTFSYLHLHISHLHIYISGLEASDTQVEYSVIQTFRFLIQILQFLGRLLPEKNSLHLELFHEIKLFSHYHGSSSHRESTAYSFRRISSLFNRWNYAHITDRLFFKTTGFCF